MRHQRRSGRIAAAALSSTILLLGLFPPTAVAQLPDHLQCHKMKDAVKFSGTIIDLVTPLAAFQAIGDCEIQGRARKICVPVEKTVLSLGTAPGTAIGPGPDLGTSAYICYKTKCRRSAIPDSTFTDQFESRQLTKIKHSREVCVPAVEGMLTTTTMVVITTTTVPVTTTTLPVTTTTTTTTTTTSTTTTTTSTTTTTLDQCLGVDCDDGNECTDDVCDPAGNGGAPCTVGTCCVNTPNDSNACTTCAGIGGATCECSAGVCIDGLICPPPTIVGQASTVCRNSFNQAVSAFSIDMSIDLDDCALDGSSFTATVTPTLNMDQVFLQEAVDTLCGLGILLTEADITVAQVQLDALAGASCTPALAGPVSGLIPLDITVSGSCPGATLTVNSPLPIGLPPTNVTCTAGAAPGPVGMCGVGSTPAFAVAGATAVNTWAAVNIGFPTDVSFQCGDGVVSPDTPCTSDPDCAAIVGNDGTQSTCDLAPGLCTTVPLDLDPATQCTTFAVEP